MKIDILSEKQNPLLHRKEVVFKVHHNLGEPTPSRLEIRKSLATKLKLKVDLVFVDKIHTKTGTTNSIGEANAYDTTENSKKVEPDHIVARNIPSEKPEAKVEKPEAKVEKPEAKVEKPEAKVEKPETKTREQDRKTTHKGETAKAPNEPKDETDSPKSETAVADEGGK